jgi:hypothetical protein
MLNVLNGCEFKDCMYEKICPKNKGYIKENKFGCDLYDNDFTYMQKLAEKYMEKDK